MDKKSERWCFTCWDFNSVMWWKTHKMHLVRVMIVGQEICQTTGKLHFQGYVVFKKAYTFGSVKRIWPDKETHWEIAKEGDRACIAYCSKDGKLLINHNILINHISWDDLLV